MRLLILGAGGLIGRELARQVVAEPTPFTQMVIADRTPIDAPAGRLPVRTAQCDVCDAGSLAPLLAEADCVVHLAALLAAEAEADLARGLEVNLHGLLRVLEGCTAQSPRPMLIAASSIAAFGGALPEVVDDHVARTPQTSYGTQKAIAELLIDDFSRRGLVDGRVLRLPIVLVRNGPPSTAISDRVAALIREPLSGRDLVCGLAPQTRMPVASAARVAAALRRLATVPAALLGLHRAMNLPSLSVTASEIVEAVQHSNVRKIGRVSFAADPALQAVVGGWPRRFVSERASAFGLTADADMDEIVARFVQENDLATG